MEFTETEQKILELMFSNMDNILDMLDTYSLDNDSFSRNDLFNLAEKLGINY